MTLLSRLFGGNPKRLAAVRGPSRLGIEALEDRTMPANVTVVPLVGDANNSTTFRTLQDAIQAAGTNGVVTIQPGAVADYNIDITQDGLTIQGDPNVPSSILPAYNISVNANNVTFKNINVNFISMNPGFSGMNISRSTIGSIFIGGGSSGNGNNTITQNTFTGDVTIIGNTNAGLATNDRITNNTFTSFSETIISVSSSSGTIVQDNIINGGGAITFTTTGTSITKAPQTGIAVNGGTNVLVANNKIKLSGEAGTPGGATGTFTGIAVNPFDPSFAGLPANTAVAAPNVRVLTNYIQTGRGIGLAIQAQAGATGDRDTQVLAQGNDFHNNLIGVNYKGSGGDTITTDLGGGALGSLGGNNFRGFTSRATAVAGAILLQGVAGGTLSAQRNLFQTGTAPQTVVLATPGAINVSNPLTNDQAFVQTLYTNYLGRTGTLNELNSWVTTLNSGQNGRNDVINGILRSDAGLGRVIDAFYIKYLGRQADSGGRDFWVGKIKNGETLESIQAGFISSAEFISSNNSDYVQGLFRTFLGRTGNSSELGFWYEKLPNLGLAGVALGFATSGENRNGFVGTIYKDYLHKTPTPGEVAFWSGQPGDLLSIHAQILASNEYFNKG